MLAGVGVTHGDWHAVCYFQWHIGACPLCVFGGQNQQTSFALTISQSGTGSASVTKDGNAVASGSNLNEDDEIEISIAPAEGQVPTATLNGSEIELTESDGVYTGNFAMPAQASTLVINTGTTGSGGDNHNPIDTGN